MRIRGRACVVTVAAILMASCATIIAGRTQAVYVETPEVEGARCDFSDSKSVQSLLPSTPGAVMVRKGDGPLTVTCRKEGYETKIVKVEETVSGLVFGNILLGGVVGIIIDATTGAAQKYPDKLVVWLKPNEFASKEEEAAWLRRREGYGAMFEEPATTGVEALEAPLVDPARRARIEEYIATNQRRFEFAILEFQQENTYGGVGPRPRIYSHEVVEASERRTVLRIGYSRGRPASASYPNRPETKLFLVRWVGDDLEVVSQRDAPRMEASSL